MIINIIQDASLIFFRSSIYLELLVFQATDIRKVKRNQYTIKRSSITFQDLTQT